jgi:hypothetical protein
MTLGIKAYLSTLSINAHSAYDKSFIMLSVVIVYCYVECHYAECHYADSRGAKGIPIFNLFYVTALVKRKLRCLNKKIYFSLPLLTLKKTTYSK